MSCSSRIALKDINVGLGGGGKGSPSWDLTILDIACGAMVDQFKLFTDILQLSRAGSGNSVGCR